MTIQNKNFSFGEIPQVVELSDKEYLEICRANKYASDDSVSKDSDVAKDFTDLFEKASSVPVMNRERIVKFRGSDESRDRSGDIIRVPGWDLKNYRKNPVILYQHNRNAPVARAVKVWKETSDAGAPGNKSLMFLVYFPETDKDSSEIFEKVKSGILSTVSVGFRPIKTNRPSSDEERNKLGLGRFGAEYQKQELFELSIVSVPDNPNATTTKGNGEPEEMESKELICRLMDVVNDLRQELKEIGTKVVSKSDESQDGGEGEQDGSTPNPKAKDLADAEDEKALEELTQKFQNMNQMFEKGEQS